MVQIQFMEVTFRLHVLVLFLQSQYGVYGNLYWYFSGQSANLGI